MRRGWVDCGSLSLWVLPEIVLFYLLLVPRGGFDATHGSSGLEALLAGGGSGVAVRAEASRLSLS